MNKLSEQLQSLPDFDPPPGGWPQLERTMNVRRRRTRAWQGGLALAASLMVTLAITLPRPVPLPGPAPAAAPTQVAQLMARSRQLEDQLSQVRPQVVAWNGALAARAVNLQNDLTVVDLQLNYARDDGAQRLWQDRVELMSQLVQTHRQAASLKSYPDSQQEISL